MTGKVMAEAVNGRGAELRFKLDSQILANATIDQARFRNSLIISRDDRSHACIRSGFRSVTPLPGH